MRQGDDVNGGERSTMCLAVAAVLSLVLALGAVGPAGAADCPNEAIRAQQGSTHLPNCRAFELVTPVDKGPAGSVNPGLTNRHLVPFQASMDGDSVVWPLQNGLPGTTAGGWLRMKATRAEDGWLSEQVSPPSLIPPPEVGGGFAEPSQALYAPPDLGCVLLESFQPLTPDIPPLSRELGVQNLFRWNAADGSYDLITNRLPLNPEVPRSLPTFHRQIFSSDDCGRAYFRSDYDLIAGGSGYYEWHDGVLSDAGVLPDGTVGADMPVGGDVDTSFSTPVVPGAEVDNRATDSWNAVSDDGSRFFFTAIPNEGTSTPGRPAVFMREIQADGSAIVTEISESKTLVPTNGARFEAASPDGSRVFFRANYGIAGTGSAGPTGQACGPAFVTETVFGTSIPIEAKQCDLSASDTENGALTDVSAHPGHPDGAQIQGTVAVDEDGSHVYFAALGQLVPGQGSTYAENVAAQSANIYLSAGGALSYVATLKGGSAGPDLNGGVLMRRPLNSTARTSADGGVLLFSSSANLTGYDSGGRQVAYLWSADTGAMSCVSCPPDGSPTLPPVGNLLSNGEVRSLSEDGSRVFFTSANPLAPGAVAGKRNVYQWEEGQVSFLAIGERLGSGGIISELVGYEGASADGDSAFIATNEQLVPQDRDLIGDVYAVRVDGGFLFVPPPPACQVDESIPLQPNQIYCRVVPAPRGSLDPSSSSVTGAGNVHNCARRARRAQRLSKRAKVLRRRARRAARASNHRTARRNGKRARRFAKAARRNSRAAKRCRRRARAVNSNRGGAR